MKHFNLHKDPKQDHQAYISIIETTLSTSTHKGYKITAPSPTELHTLHMNKLEAQFKRLVFYSIALLTFFLVGYIFF